MLTRFLIDLSNDLLLEIFDYLDIFDLFQAFFSLNQRFNSLLTDRHLNVQANMNALTVERLQIYLREIFPRIASHLRHLSISDECGHLQIVLRSSSPFLGLQTLKLYQVELFELQKILRLQSPLQYLQIDTNQIQNEKHLKEIFDLILYQQPSLRFIQLNFHTHLHFVTQKKDKISQIRRVNVDCECFSSDLLVLISQLPELRHLSARINDKYRGCMDKDIDNLSGNTSIRSLILHIKNVKLDRLRLVLSWMSNMRILELYGTIDFNIEHLVELKRSYTSFKYQLVRYT